MRTPTTFPLHFLPDISPNAENSPVRTRTVCGQQSGKYCRPPIGISSSRTVQEAFALATVYRKQRRPYLNPKEVGRLLDSLSEPRPAGYRRSIRTKLL